MAWKSLLLGQVALAVAQASVRVVTVIVHQCSGSIVGFPTTLNYATSSASFSVLATGRPTDGEYRTTVVTYTGTHITSFPLITTIYPSGNLPGVVEIATPSGYRPPQLFITVLEQYTGTLQLNDATTLTTISPLGTAPGTYIVQYPASPNYITITRPGDDSLSTRTTVTTIQPSDSQPGTIIIQTPVALLLSSEVSTTSTAGPMEPEGSLTPLACPMAICDEQSTNATLCDNTYGSSFNVTCGRRLLGNIAASADARDTNSCLVACDSIPGCVGTNFYSPNPDEFANCELFDLVAYGEQALGVAASERAFISDDDQEDTTNTAPFLEPSLEPSSEPYSEPYSEPSSEPSSESVFWAVQASAYVSSGPLIRGSTYFVSYSMANTASIGWQTTTRPYSGTAEITGSTTVSTVYPSGTASGLYNVEIPMASPSDASEGASAPLASPSATSGLVSSLFAQAPSPLTGTLPSFEPTSASELIAPEPGVGSLSSGSSSLSSYTSSNLPLSEGNLAGSATITPLPLSGMPPSSFPGVQSSDTDPVSSSAGSMAFSESLDTSRLPGLASSTSLLSSSPVSVSEASSPTASTRPSFRCDLHDNSVIVAPSGNTYDLSCGSNAAGRLISQLLASSDFNDCIVYCEVNSNCLAWTYEGAVSASGPGICFLKGSTDAGDDPYFTFAGPNMVSGLRRPAPPGSQSTSTLLASSLDATTLSISFMVSTAGSTTRPAHISDSASNTLGRSSLGSQSATDGTSDFNPISTLLQTQSSEFSPSEASSTVSSSTPLGFYVTTTRVWTDTDPLTQPSTVTRIDPFGTDPGTAVIEIQPLSTHLPSSSSSDVPSWTSSESQSSDTSASQAASSIVTTSLTVSLRTTEPATSLPTSYASELSSPVPLSSLSATTASSSPDVPGSTSSAPPTQISLSSCPDSDGAVLGPPGGGSYLIACQSDIGGAYEISSQRVTSSYQECLPLCDALEMCQGFSWLGVDGASNGIGPGWCFFKNSTSPLSFMGGESEAMLAAIMIAAPASEVSTSGGSSSSSTFDYYVTSTRPHSGTIALVQHTTVTTIPPDAGLPGTIITETPSPDPTVTAQLSASSTDSRLLSYTDPGVAAGQSSSVLPFLSTEALSSGSGSSTGQIITSLSSFSGTQIKSSSIAPTSDVAITTASTTLSSASRASGSSSLVTGTELSTTVPASSTSLLDPSSSGSSFAEVSTVSFEGSTASSQASSGALTASEALTASFATTSTQLPPSASTSTTLGISSSTPLSSLGSLSDSASSSVESSSATPPSESSSAAQLPTTTPSPLGTITSTTYGSYAGTTTLTESPWTGTQSGTVVIGIPVTPLTLMTTSSTTVTSLASTTQTTTTTAPRASSGSIAASLTTPGSSISPTYTSTATSTDTAQATTATQLTISQAITTQSSSLSTETSQPTYAAAAACPDVDNQVVAGAANVPYRIRCRYDNTGITFAQYQSTTTSYAECFARCDDDVSCLAFSWLGNGMAVNGNGVGSCYFKSRDTNGQYPVFVGEGTNTALLALIKLTPAQAASSAAPPLYTTSYTVYYPSGTMSQTYTATSVAPSGTARGTIVVARPIPTSPCLVDGYLSQINVVYRVDINLGNVTQLFTMELGPNLNPGATGQPINGINSIAYNAIDNYLYGTLRGPNPETLVRIGYDGSYQPLLNLPGNSSVYLRYFVGDIDANGQYYTASQQFSVWRYVQVNLNPNLPNYGQVVGTGATTLPSGGTVQDWAFVPGGGQILYALAAQDNGVTTLNAFQLSTLTWVIIGTYPGIVVNRQQTIDASGATQTPRWNALYASSNGYLYGTEGHSGQLWRFSIRLPLNATYVSQGPRAADADGARCITNTTPL